MFLHYVVIYYHLSHFMSFIGFYVNNYIIIYNKKSRDMPP